MPWNPMRVEQRIGRIDRLGQQHPTIRIINLHYDGTVETDVYRALRNRIGLFQSVIGRLQPILEQMPSRIAASILCDRAQVESEGYRIVGDIEAAVRTAGQSGFDIDMATDEDLTPPVRPEPRLTLNDLEQVLRREDAMPPGIAVEPMPPREFRYLAPGMSAPLRVTTDREFYEEHAESVELWSPGSPLFPDTEQVLCDHDFSDASLAKLFLSSGG